uniref:Uncharacterized protein n=1 Tax=Rhodnius prolixus TaxID=13249 RepID=T1IA72_RHOPR
MREQVSEVGAELVNKEMKEKKLTVYDGLYLCESRLINLVIIDTNDQIKIPKDRQIYFEGAHIPVQLVYEADDETQAIVKEVSVESLLKKPQGKLLNRVQRSEVSSLENEFNLKKPLIENYQFRENEKGNKNAPSNAEALTETSKDESAQIAETGEIFPINTDELNKGLGIEARGTTKGIEALNAQPPQQSSILDYNFNIIKELIKNMNDQRKNEGIRKTVQHYQSMLHPARTSLHLPFSQSHFSAMKNLNTQGPPKVMKVISYYPIFSAVDLLSPSQVESSNNEKIIDDYFQVTMDNPINSMWSALTNVVEYGPESEICKSESKLKRKKRELIDDRIEIPQNILDDLSRQSGFGFARPNIMKLKVRRGGIAIAGPGGIATAGSGGTTIVGPGGTAYTPPDATAVVGPGGRVVHISNFDPSEVHSRTTDISKFFKNGRVVAHGPVVIYNPPSVVESL